MPSEKTPEQIARCKHVHFNANVSVNRMADTGRFSADVTIKCVDCGIPMRFIGLPGGLDMNGASVSADACEARLSIAPLGEVIPPLDPRAAHGFSIRATGALPHDH